MKHFSLKLKWYPNLLKNNLPVCNSKRGEGKRRDHKDRPKPSLGELGNCRIADFLSMLDGGKGVLLPWPVRVCKMTRVLAGRLFSAANLAVSPPSISTAGKGSAYFQFPPESHSFPSLIPSSSFLSRSFLG